MRIRITLAALAVTATAALTLPALPAQAVVDPTVGNDARVTRQTYVRHDLGTRPHDRGLQLDRRRPTTAT